MQNAVNRVLDHFNFVVETLNGASHLRQAVVKVVLLWINARVAEQVDVFV